MIARIKEVKNSLSEASKYYEYSLSVDPFDKEIIGRCIRFYKANGDFIRVKKLLQLFLKFRKKSRFGNRMNFHFITNYLVPNLPNHPKTGLWLQEALESFQVLLDKKPKPKELAWCVKNSHFFNPRANYGSFFVFSGLLKVLKCLNIQDQHVHF